MSGLNFDKMFPFPGEKAIENQRRPLEMEIELAAHPRFPAVLRAAVAAPAAADGGAEERRFAIGVEFRMLIARTNADPGHLSCRYDQRKNIVVIHLLSSVG